MSSPRLAPGPFSVFTQDLSGTVVQDRILSILVPRREA